MIQSKIATTLKWQKSRKIYRILLLIIIFIMFSFGIYLIWQGSSELSEINHKVSSIMHQAGLSRSIDTASLLVIHANTKIAYSRLIGGGLFLAGGVFFLLLISMIQTLSYLQAATDHTNQPAPVPQGVTRE